MKKGILQEANWAGALYWQAMSESKEELNKNLELFVAHFPNSPFIKYIKERFNSFVDESNINKTADKEFIFLETNYYNSIEQIVKTKFYNEFVLVDLWATWCSPCLYELKYKNRVKTFLNKNKIQLLYLSIDDSSQQEFWKKFVKKNGLSGTHLLASKDLANRISNSLYDGKDISIPRYLLINKNGKIVNSDLPMPSSQDQFELKIMSLIQNK
jgi:thiol-disulfide isomerase/thioredoxin